LIADWVAGRRTETSFRGPALAMVQSGQSELIGQLELGDNGADLVEFVCGVAPHQRGHGYASAAVVSLARWLLQGGLAMEIELRIGEHSIASQRAVAKAGSLAAGTVVSHAPATGAS